MLTTRPHHRPAQPGPGARALYLGGREHKQVSCTDEALVVTNARTQLFERWSTHNAAALTLHLTHLHRTALKAMHN